MAFVEAIQIYLDLLRNHKDRALKMRLEHEHARLVHNEMAIQFALQKVLIQRIRGDDLVTIDLAQFTHKHPFKIQYGANACAFLEHWKDGSDTFHKNRALAQERYTHLSKTYMDGQGNLDVVPGDVYAALWLVTDILDLETHLPDELTGYVNLGCGCGLFDGTFLQGKRNCTPASLIDIDPAPELSISEQISIHDLTHTAFSKEWTGYGNPPSPVLSIRSCGFLYGVDSYDSLFRSLETESQVLLDVAHRYVNETVGYFESIGAKTLKHPRINESVQLLEFRF